jgi:hypothetical protein
VLPTWPVVTVDYARLASAGSEEHMHNNGTLRVHCYS